MEFLLLQLTEEKIIAFHSKLSDLMKKALHVISSRMYALHYFKWHYSGVEAENGHFFGITPRVTVFSVLPLFSRPKNTYRCISIILVSNFRDFLRNLSEEVKLKLK